MPSIHGANVGGTEYDLLVQDPNFATIEETTTASKAYNVGEFLVYGGILYKVVQNIASGGTLVIGTNINPRQVGPELTSINASLTELDDNLTASDNHKFEFMTDGDGNYGYRGADDSFVPFSSLENAKVWVFNNATGYLDGFNPFTMEKLRACDSHGNGSLSYGDLSITWSNCNATSNKRLLYFGPEAQGSNTPVIKTIQPNVASHLYGYYQGLACAFIVLDPITVN